MCIPELTTWSNDDGTHTVATSAGHTVLGRFRDDDPDGWRAWLGADTTTLKFIGEYEDYEDASAAIAEAAEAEGLI
ncbi:hypothetical protein [Curtobacterium sp. B18]|uniref:hypothetical protein n=1 Tax=Curtobacterium sp. B18 TaxID=95614 RepID=UPI00034AD3D6|nr:hypothetical protein [Curtobacterium sp. B18]